MVTNLKKPIPQKLETILKTPQISIKTSPAGWLFCQPHDESMMTASAVVAVARSDLWRREVRRPRKRERERETE